MGTNLCSSHPDRIAPCSCYFYLTTGMRRGREERELAPLSFLGGLNDFKLTSLANAGPGIFFFFLSLRVCVCVETMCIVNFKPSSAQQTGSFLCIDIYTHNWGFWLTRINTVANKPRRVEKCYFSRVRSIPFPRMPQAYPSDVFEVYYLIFPSLENFLRVLVKGQKPGHLRQWGLRTFLKTKDK